MRYRIEIKDDVKKEAFAIIQTSDKDFVQGFCSTCPKAVTIYDTQTSQVIEVTPDMTRREIHSTVAMFVSAGE